MKTRTVATYRSQQYVLARIPTLLKPRVLWLEEGGTYEGEPISPSQGSLGMGVRLRNPKDPEQSCVVAEEDLRAMD